MLVSGDIVPSPSPLFSSLPSTSRVREKEKRNSAVTGRGYLPPCLHHLPLNGDHRWRRASELAQRACALRAGRLGRDRASSRSVAAPSMARVITASRPWVRCSGPGGLDDGRLAVVAGTAGWGIERGRVPVRRKWAAIGRALARWPAASRARPMLHDGVTIEMAYELVEDALIQDADRPRAAPARAHGSIELVGELVRTPARLRL